MPQLPEPLERLIQELSRLPGIGRKTAQRLSVPPLRSERERAGSLAPAGEGVSVCAAAGHCWICLSTRRDAKILCVVESALDVLAIERTAEFSGLYFVLQGVISPIDGTGADQI